MCIVRTIPEEKDVCKKRGIVQTCLENLICCGSLCIIVKMMGSIRELKENNYMGDFGVRQAKCSAEVWVIMLVPELKGSVIVSLYVTVQNLIARCRSTLHIILPF